MIVVIIWILAAIVGKRHRSRDAILLESHLLVSEEGNIFDKQGECMAQPVELEKMNGVHVLALCGESLLIEGIKASLQSREGMEIVPLDTSQPSAVQDLQNLSPDIIIFELTPSLWNYIFTFLQKRTDVILIGLDITCDNALFLPGEWCVLPTVADLMRGIEERIQAKNGMRL